MEAEVATTQEAATTEDRIVGVYDRYEHRNDPAPEQNESAGAAQDQPAVQDGAADTATATGDTKPEDAVADTTTASVQDSPSAEGATTVVANTKAAETPADWAHADLKDDALANKLLAAYKAGPEEFKRFNEAMGTDWKGMSDEDVIKHDLRGQYPKLSQKAFDRLYEDELAKYGIGESFDEVAEEIGKAQMQRKASEVRNAQVAIQEQYQIADRSQPSAEQVAQQQAAAQQQQQALADLENYVINEPSFRDFETKRGITLGAGDEAFNLAAPANINLKQDILEGYPQEFFLKDKDGKVVNDKNGQPKYDVEKAILMRVIASDPKGWWDKAVSYGRTLEKKAVDKELRNPGNGIVAAPSGTEGDRIVGPVNRR